jgi:hypothetical protein
MSVVTGSTRSFSRVRLAASRVIAVVRRSEVARFRSRLPQFCFALIAARLEDALGFDPFDMSDETSFPVTYEDFIRLYETTPSSESLHHSRISDEVVNLVVRSSRY